MEYNNTTVDLVKIARMVHQTNKAWCEANGDFSQPNWEDAPEWQKASAINGVEFVMSNPDVTSEQTHENWLKVKLEDGWTYGKIKDPTTRSILVAFLIRHFPKMRSVKTHSSAL